MSLIILESDADLALFTEDDYYYYTVDNRPLRKLLKNDQALKAWLEDLASKTSQSISFVAESPSVEDGVGGAHVCRFDGEIEYVSVSIVSPGTAGDYIVDVKKNGVSIYGNPADRPVLNFADADKMVESVPPNISDGSVTSGDIITVEIVNAQTGGTPKWFRTDVDIRPTLVNVDANSI